VSLDEIHELRDKVQTVSERLARMEERQVTLIGMLERSLASFGDLSNRVNALEHLKTKVLLVAGAIGAIVSVAWDALRSRLTNGG
jgi:predicted nuclease with TOPRIM domain